jgi:hypothetical protein
MKFIFKWLLRLFILVVVLAVIFILSLDSILRVVVEHNIRAQTGMEAEIGRFHVGLIDPVIQVENLRIYNPKSFGGTPFLDIPEIHVEYDKPALADGELHLTILRFNLGELDIVKNEKGQTNIFSMGLAMPSKEEIKKNQVMEEFKKRTKLDFGGIDVLTVSVGTFKYIDLKDPKNDRTQVVGMENVPLRNVKTEADLTGLVLDVMLHSDNFFDVLMPANSNMDTLKQLGF